MGRIENTIQSILTMMKPLKFVLLMLVIRVFVSKAGDLPRAKYLVLRGQSANVS